MYVCACVCMKQKAHEGRSMSGKGIILIARYSVGSKPAALVPAPPLLPGTLGRCLSSCLTGVVGLE